MTLVACSQSAYSQKDSSKIVQSRFQGGFRSFMETGTVVQIRDNRIAISTQDGAQKEFLITPMTLIVEERSIDENQLNIGDTIQVSGQESARNVIQASSITVLSVVQQNQQLQQPPQPGGFKRDSFPQQPQQPQQPPQPGGFRRDSFPQQPDSGKAGGGRGFRGRIYQLNPLMIETDAGQSMTVQLTSQTVLRKEFPQNISALETGSSVTIISPPAQQNQMRAAVKVVVLFQEQEETFTPEDEAGAEKLLPDLHQQAITSDFIYGIWLGRGLYSHKELKRAFRVAKNLGVKYLKIEFKWGYVEPENDRWQWRNKDTLDVDYVIQLANIYDFSLIPYFSLISPWGQKRFVSPQRGDCEGPPSGGQVQAPDPGEYAEYVFSVIDKLKRNRVDVRYVELDNEVSNLNDGYQSWNCFINVTARQIKEAENAAYDKIKASYPDVQVSSTTFSFPGIGTFAGEAFRKSNRRKNSFIKMYFKESPRPKFDFLGIHEVVAGSGNPFTTIDQSEVAGDRYNFSSYYTAYSTWRQILDTYGFKDTPIFNLESYIVTKGKQDIVLLQRAIFAKTQARGIGSLAGFCRNSQVLKNLPKVSRTSK